MIKYLEFSLWQSDFLYKEIILSLETEFKERQYGTLFGLPARERYPCSGTSLAPGASGIDL